MKTRLPWVLFAASVCFNLFFVYGYWHARTVLTQLRTREGRMEFTARKLELNVEQREKWRKLDEEKDVKFAAIWDPHRGDIDAFWAELRKDQPDRKRLDELTRKSFELKQKTDWVLLDYLVGCFGMLTPEQRARAERMVRRFSDPPRAPAKKKPEDKAGAAE